MWPAGETGKLSSLRVLQSLHIGQSPKVQWKILENVLMVETLQNFEAKVYYL